MFTLHDADIATISLQNNPFGIEEGMTLSDVENLMPEGHECSEPSNINRGKVLNYCYNSETSQVQISLVFRNLNSTGFKLTHISASYIPSYLIPK